MYFVLLFLLFLSYFLYQFPFKLNVKLRFTERDLCILCQLKWLQQQPQQDVKQPQGEKKQPQREVKQPHMDVKQPQRDT